MTDYLQEVSPGVRRLAVIALAGVAVLLAGLLALVVVVATFARARADIGAALAGCAAIFGVMFLVATWMLVRLLKNQRAANGVTMMPLRFVQGAGALVGLGMIGVSVLEGHLLFVAEGLILVLSMAIAPRAILRRAAQNGAKEEAPIDDETTRSGQLGVE